MLTSLISLDSLKEYVDKHQDHLGLKAPFSQKRKYDPDFDMNGPIGKIPKNYLDNLTSLGLAIQRDSSYEIQEEKMANLTRKFAPTLIFDSKEMNPIQLGHLTTYLFNLFSQQYALVSKEPPEAYRKFVSLWANVTSPEQFLQFLADFTDQWETPVPSDFFQTTMTTVDRSSNGSSKRQMYVNFIPGTSHAVIQYYMFFPTNDQNRFFGLLSKIIYYISWIFPSLKQYESLSVHLGDWERVDVYLKKEGDQFTRTGITYAAHGKTNIHKTGELAKEVFVLQGGHGTRPSPFPIDLMFDNCDGKGESLDLTESKISFIPISLHHLLGNSLEIKCLTSILKHGPKGSPDSVVKQRFYAADPSLLEYIRRNKAWQPNQPLMGALWRFFYPPKPDPNIFIWDPSGG